VLVFREKGVNMKYMKSSDNVHILFLIFILVFITEIILISCNQFDLSKIEKRENIIADTPYFSHEGKIYNDNFNVTISTDTDDAAIYYTTDGSLPSKSNYAGHSIESIQVTVDRMMIIKAITLKDNVEPSIIAEEFYIIEKKITAFNGTINDGFGCEISVSSDGSVILAGAVFDSDKGAAYIYRRDGSLWEETKIIASDGSTGDRFGSSIVISEDGNTAVVSAPGDGDGSAYVYKWNGSSWGETKLLPTSLIAYQVFGGAVAVSSTGDRVIVEVYDNYYDGSFQSGAAYLYDWNGSLWIETKLSSSDGMSGDDFGYSMDFSSDGNILAVSSVLDDDKGNNSGSVYVYRWNGSLWDERKITASDGSSNDLFGYTVSISSDGNTLVVGSKKDDDNGTDSGSVYIYRWDNSLWIETKIIASDSDTEDEFGHSVSVSADGNIVLVGSHYNDDKIGAAYIYKLQEELWQETKIVASDVVVNDKLGHSVSVSSNGNTVIISAFNDDYIGESSGPVYVYRL